MGRTDRVTKGTIVALIQYTLQIGFQVLLSPLLLKVAGQEVLGAYAVLTQVIGYLALLNLSSILSLTRYLSFSYGIDDDGIQYQKVLSMGHTVLVFTNILFAILTAIFSLFSNKLFHFSENIASQFTLAFTMRWLYVSTT